ncbi:MAG: chromosomal replication initiation protein DnaA, partial [Proteobacteria bacterium]
RKADIEDLELPDDVAMLVARHVTHNVRELEGAMMRLAAASKLMHRPIDRELAEQTLSDIIGHGLKRVQPDQVIKAVCQEFRVSLADIKGPRRHRTITVPRQIAMYLLRELTEESLPQIGNLFGGRDHSTVINALKRVKAIREGKPDVKARIETIRRQLRD